MKRLLIVALALVAIGPTVAAQTLNPYALTRSNTGIVPSQTNPPYFRIANFSEGNWPSDPASGEGWLVWDSGNHYPAFWNGTAWDVVALASDYLPALLLDGSTRMTGSIEMASAGTQSRYWWFSVEGMNNTDFVLRYTWNSGTEGRIKVGARNIYLNNADYPNADDWVPVWSQINDGAGSGLDADTVDGSEVSVNFLPRAGGNMSGAIAWQSPGNNTAFQYVLNTGIVPTTTVTFTAPTENRTLAFPNASGTLAVTSDIPSTPSLSAVTAVGSTTTDNISITGSAGSNFQAVVGGGDNLGTQYSALNITHTGTDNGQYTIGFPATGSGTVTLPANVVGTLATLENAQTFTATQTTTCTTTPAIVATATLDNATGDEVAYTLNYTTNKATSGADTGLKIAMTDTASPGTSNLVDMTVGGVSKFSVSNAGAVAAASKMTASSFQSATSTAWGTSLGLDTAGLVFGPSARFAWSPTSVDSGALDTGLTRSAAGVVKVTDGSTGIGDLTAGTLIANDGATAAGTIAVYEDTDNGTNKATITVPALAADYTLTLPTTDGNANEFLQTDGSGNLTWAAGGAGGSPAGSGTELQYRDTTNFGAVAGTAVSSGVIQLSNGATSAGRIAFVEDSDNGTNAVTLQGPASTADVTVTLPAVTDTLAVLGANTFTTGQSIIGSADRVQLLVRGNATQTSNVLEVENSGTSDMVTVSGTGKLTVSGSPGNATFIAARLANASNPASTNNSQAVELEFALSGTYNNGSSYGMWPAGVVKLYKTDDFHDISGTNSWDAGFMFTVYKDGGGTTPFAIRPDLTVAVPPGNQYAWSNTAGDPTAATLRAGLSNPSSGLVAITNGTTGDGDLRMQDNIEFEGSSADANETQLAVVNPSQDQTVTIPDASGTVVLASYGEMTDEDAGAWTLTDQNTWYGYADFDTGEVSSTGYVTYTNGTPDSLTIGASGAGVYLTSLSASFTGEASQTYECHVYKEGVTTNMGFTRTMGTSATEGSASAIGILTLAANDDVSMYCRCTSGASKTLTFSHLDLTTHRIGF